MSGANEKTAGFVREKLEAMTNARLESLPGGNRRPQARFYGVDVYEGGEAAVAVEVRAAPGEPEWARIEWLVINRCWGIDDEGRPFIHEGAKERIYEAFGAESLAVSHGGRG